MVKTGIGLMLLLISVPELSPAEISGRLEYHEGRSPYLRTEGRPLPLRILFANEDVAEDVSTLANGDELTGEGEIIEAQSQIRLHNITAVGVQKILGTWKTVSGDRAFNFWSFDTVYVQTPEETQTRRWFYELKPESKDKWSIQLESEKFIEFGTIEYRKTTKVERLTFCYLDPDTGAVKSKYTLERYLAKGHLDNNAPKKP